MLQAVLKALLQDRKAAETPKEAKAAKFALRVRAWARLKAFILLVLLLYSIPGVLGSGCSMRSCAARPGFEQGCLQVFLLLYMWQMQGGKSKVLHDSDQSDQTSWEKMY